MGVVIKETWSITTTMGESLGVVLDYKENGFNSPREAYNKLIGTKIQLNNKEYIIIGIERWGGVDSLSPRDNLISLLARYDEPRLTIPINYQEREEVKDNRDTPTTERSSSFPLQDRHRGFTRAM